MERKIIGVWVEGEPDPDRVDNNDAINQSGVSCDEVK
jgi:hypothetical protein